jgi:hypothetical protein
MASIREKLLSLRLKENFITDAWIAATTETLSKHLGTIDRDLKRLLPARDLTVLGSSS